MFVQFRQGEFCAEKMFAETFFEDRGEKAQKSPKK